MGEATFIKRDTDPSGEDVGVWKSASDDTYIIQTAHTNDEGVLRGKAQAFFLFVAYRPHLRSHGSVGDSI